MLNLNKLIHDHNTQSNRTQLPNDSFFMELSAGLVNTNLFFKYRLMMFSLSNFLFFQQDFASYEMADNDDNNGVVPQRRGQVSQEQEDLVVKGKFRKIYTFLIFSV